MYKEAQELPVNPPRGEHDARQEGLGGARPVGICLAVPRRLGARSGLKTVDYRQRWLQTRSSGPGGPAGSVRSVGHSPAFGT